MLVFKYLLMTLGGGMFVAGIGVAAYDLWLGVQYQRKVNAGVESAPPEPVRWRTTVALCLMAWAPILVALSFIMVPSGMAGVRISQTRGTEPGTLYPGVHGVIPLLEHVELFDMRDKLYTTGVVDNSKKTGTGTKAEVLNVQSKEGLSIGLAVMLRYRLDPSRLDYIQLHLPQPVDSEKLGADAVLVKEVMLSDIQLPPEYAKGLEQLLLKEQQDDQLNVQTDIKQKQVKIGELEAEAEKVQKVKAAEGEAQARVVGAKGEADAMQYALPLKEKQIEQSKLEAEARKEATIKNAEAAAQAKVIDSKAELERRNLLADAEANRIRVTAAADAERMRSEAAVLKQTPLLINKIIAEKLSDKIQLMMVPAEESTSSQAMCSKDSVPNKHCQKSMSRRTWRRGSRTEWVATSIAGWMLVAYLCVGEFVA